MDRRHFIKGLSSIVAGTSVGGISKTLVAEPMGNKVEKIRDQSLTTIAFGSCNRQGLPQSHWNVISQDNPDLWLWLGDNIYADWKTPEGRLDEWSKLKFEKNYDQFRKNTPIMGIWDDHDYAGNNKGKAFKEKKISQELFANFLEVPYDHPMRNQEGIYHSKTFGPKGKQTQLFMLDLRYFKSNPATGGLIGEVQWQWLEAELQASTADLIIIATSIHLTSGLSGLSLEGWNSYPEERLRLYDQIEALDVPAIVLSGDRHMAEFAKKKLESGNSIYEFMSSGLTHAWLAPLPDPNRIGKTVGIKNYGLINIDWTDQGPMVNLQIKDASRQGVIQQLNPDFSS